MTEEEEYTFLVVENVQVVREKEERYVKKR
jgi:hypothetical protein